MSDTALVVLALGGAWLLLRDRGMTYAPPLPAQALPLPQQQQLPTNGMLAQAQGTVNQFGQLVGSLGQIAGSVVDIINRFDQPSYGAQVGARIGALASYPTGGPDVARQFFSGGYL